MPNSIQFAIDYSTRYINLVDKSGILDPFNYFDVIEMHWAKEPRSVHQDFVNMINVVFGTTSYRKVGDQINQFLIPAAEARIQRLIELRAPEIIIQNQQAFKDSLLNDDALPHMLISMLVVSIYRAQ